MNARLLLIVTATAIATIGPPTLSLADDTAAMDACVNAFVSTNLPKDRKIRVQIAPPSTSLQVAQGSSYEIALTARGAQSGRQIAKATCVVHADGSVTAL